MRYLFATMVILLCLGDSAAALSKDVAYETELGRTVLVEERTAIWCPSCAEIDPQLEVVSRAHGSRTAFVALHVDDEFENNASRERIRYQAQTDSNAYGTPTFFVDGSMTAEGYDAWSDVQSRILSQESSRSAPEELSFSIEGGQIFYDLPSDGQLTIMVLEHDKPVPAEADNPGEDHRDRVLMGMKVVDVNGTSKTYGDLTLPEVWSVVFVHEPIEGGEPYGVAELSNVVHEEKQKDASLAIAVLICVAIGSMLLLLPEKYFRYQEEE